VQGLRSTSNAVQHVHNACFLIQHPDIFAITGCMLACLASAE